MLITGVELYDDFAQLIRSGGYQSLRIKIAIVSSDANVDADSHKFARFVGSCK